MIRLNINGETFGDMFGVPVQRMRELMGLADDVFNSSEERQRPLLEAVAKLIELGRTENEISVLSYFAGIATQKILDQEDSQEKIINFLAANAIKE